MSGGGLNLAEDLRRAARERPEHPAIIFAGERTAYSTLDREADRIAAGLYRLGIRKGDRVVFSLANRPVFAELYYGILRAEAVAVPLNPALKAGDFRPFLTALAPRAIIADESAVGEVMTAGPHSAPVFVVGAHPTARAFSEIASDSAPPPGDTSSEDVAVVAYTGGAVEPRGATLSHGNLAANIDSVLEIPGLDISPEDVVLGAVGLHHLYALNVVLGVAVRAGATVLLQEKFDPERSLEEAAMQGVTVLVGVPPMYREWLKGNRPVDLSTVRLAVSGGAALGPQLIEEFRSRFGVEIWEGYGLTETSSVVTTTRMGEQRPGSVGLPLPGVEVRVVDATGAEVLPGDPGEIWVRGPSVFKGYWGDANASREAFSGDWLQTGDLGYRDEDGYLFFVGRREDVVFVAGFPVYPKEVEEVLRTHSAVADAAAVGESDPKQGTRIKGFVALKKGATAGKEQLLVYCAARLARFKVPSEIEFVDAIPRLDSGRLNRHLLGREGG